jgi:hypothetical protein
MKLQNDDLISLSGPAWFWILAPCWLISLRSLSPMTCHCVSNTVLTSMGFKLRIAGAAWRQACSINLQAQHQVPWIRLVQDSLPSYRTCCSAGFIASVGPLGCQRFQNPMCEAVVATWREGCSCRRFWFDPPSSSYRRAVGDDCEF